MYLHLAFPSSFIDKLLMIILYWLHTSRKKKKKREIHELTIKLSTRITNVNMCIYLLIGLFFIYTTKLLMSVVQWLSRGKRETWVTIKCTNEQREYLCHPLPRSWLFLCPALNPVRAPERWERKERGKIGWREKPGQWMNNWRENMIKKRMDRIWERKEWIECEKEKSG